MNISRSSFPPNRKPLLFTDGTCGPTRRGGPRWSVRGTTMRSRCCVAEFAKRMANCGPSEWWFACRFTSRGPRGLRSPTGAAICPALSTGYSICSYCCSQFARQRRRAAPSTSTSIRAIRHAARTRKIGPFPISHPRPRTRARRRPSPPDRTGRAPLGSAMPAGTCAPRPPSTAG